VGIWVIFAILGVFAVFGFFTFISYYIVDRSKYVRTISDVAPFNGEITANAGAGIAVVPSIGTSSILFQDVNVRDSLLPYDDAQSTQVQYGHLLSGPQAEWRMRTLAGFDSAYMPGLLPGSDGQGNTAGTSWVVPAAGQYTVTATCSAFPGVITATDIYTLDIAIKLGADNVNPDTGAGYVPDGGRTEILFPSMTALSTSMTVALSTNFQAGCASCPVGIGQALTFHSYLNHIGGGAASTFFMYCQFSVTRNK
jgi:hypothetical protein